MLCEAPRDGTSSGAGFQDPRVRLSIAGERDPRYEVARWRLTEKQHLGERIQVLTPRSDVAVVMHDASVVASASIKPKPFGRVCVEAQAAERPILATALGGPKETVVDGATGWLISYPSVEGMQAGIMRALRDRPRVKDPGRGGARRAQLHFPGTVLPDRFIDHVSRRAL